MSLTKYASYDAEVLDVRGTYNRSHIASLDKLADFDKYRTGDGYLYARIRAISSRVNRNWDGWPSVELAGSKSILDHRHSGGGFTIEASEGNPEFGFATFVGKPIFVDHHNSNPKKARGVIVDAKLNVLDKTSTAHDSYWTSHDVDSEHMPPTEVELLLEVDAKSFPRLAQAIVSGDLDGFSMGCDVLESRCSHCGHIATNPEEYCSHILMKGAHHDYKTADGKRTSKKSYENCYGIQFFEISAVFDPADETALAREIRAAVYKEADIAPGPPPGMGGKPDPVRPHDTEVADLAMQYEMQGIDPDNAMELAQRKIEQQYGKPPGHGEGFSVEGLPKQWNYDQIPQPVADSGYLSPSTEYLRNDPRWSAFKRTAENPLPQEMMTRAPEELDTLRDEQLCPICFAPGTLVRTARGLIPIEHVQIGDHALTESGYYELVTKVHQTPYDGDLLRIDVGAASEPILTTPNHPFKTIISQHDECHPGICDKASSFDDTHVLGWAHAHHLTPGSYLTVNTPQYSYDLEKIIIPERFVTERRHGSNALPLTNDVLWAIGLYLAEGSAGKREITFSLNRKEKIYQHRLQDIFHGLGYTSRITLRNDKPNSAWVHIHSSTLAEWWPEWLGKGCDHKVIPGELMNLPDERVHALLQGVMDGDGSDTTDILKQTSSRLASQVTELSHRLHNTKHSASICREKVPDKRIAYVVSNVLGSGTKHIDRPQRKVRFGHGKWELDGRTLHRIRSIEHIPYQGSVYNLSVAGNHTYTVQNILVHNCGNDMDSETCQICGYVQPPKEFDNPDLTKAVEIRERMKQQEEQQSTQPPNQPGGQIGEESQPGGGGGMPANPTKAPATAGVKNEMHNWTPKVHPKTAARINQVERPVNASNPPVSDEPRKEIVTQDQTKPVTSAMRNAQQLMADAQRNHTGASMQTRTADGPTPPGDTSPKTRVEVNGVGGVDEASNDAASKADAQIDVTGIGTTGVSDVAADSTASLPTAGRESDDAGFNTEHTTEDSGPTKTYGDKDGQHPGVGDPVTREPFPASEDAVKRSYQVRSYDDNTLEQNEQQGDPVAQGGSAVQGVQPVDSVATDSYKRVNLLEHQTSPSNNSGPTTTWTGTDGNGVLKQQEPVTRDSQEWGGVPVPDVKLHTGRVSLSALRLAEAELELGLISREEKWNRIAELDAHDPREIQAQLETLSRVKTAGLARLAEHRQAGVRRLPRAFGKQTAAPDGFERIATGSEVTERQLFDDETLDAGLYLK